MCIRDSLHTGPNQSSGSELGVALSAESVPNDAAEPDRYQGPEAGSAFREQVTTDVPDESTEATGLNK